MTKESYLDMCDMLGNEPDEDEIPVEMQDFPSLVQECFVVYAKLSDIWDFMNGNYGGKDYSIVFSLFDLYSIPEADRILCMELLQVIDSARAEVLAAKRETQRAANKK